MDIMVTGGTGFIGSYVVRDLVAAGHTVTVLARNPAKVSAFVDAPGIRFVAGTLQDRAAIRAAVRGQDAVIHVALGWGDTAAEMAAADTLPSLVIFDEAVQAGVPRIIYTSSIAVFDEGQPLISEDTAPRPSNLYGATKAATESYLLGLGAAANVQVTVIRPGYTFGGPGVAGGTIYTDRTLWDLVERAMRGEPITVTEHKGTQFIHAGDLSRLYLAVVGSAAHRRLYTAVSTNFTSWADVARLALEQVGSSADVQLEDGGFHPGWGRYDVSAIERDFGLAFDSSDRLREHLRWIADQV